VPVVLQVVRVVAVNVLQIAARACHLHAAWTAVRIPVAHEVERVGAGDGVPRLAQEPVRAVFIHIVAVNLVRRDAQIFESRTYSLGEVDLQFRFRYGQYSMFTARSIYCSLVRKSSHYRYQDRRTQRRCYRAAFLQRELLFQLEHLPRRTSNPKRSPLLTTL